MSPPRRIGRTGRAGKKGLATAFFAEKDTGERCTPQPPPAVAHPPRRRSLCVWCLRNAAWLVSLMLEPPLSAAPGHPWERAMYR